MIMRLCHKLQLIDHTHLGLIHLKAASFELLHHCPELFLAEFLHILIHLGQSADKALSRVSA